MTGAATYCGAAVRHRNVHCGGRNVVICHRNAAMHIFYVDCVRYVDCIRYVDCVRYVAQCK